MGMTKTVTVDGKKVLFKASAAIPRLYRNQFGRDIFKDFQTLTEKVGQNDAAQSGLDAETLETFENIAYLMARHADPAIPDTPDEWLDGFSMFSIYQVIPELISLWGLNVETMVQSKKNSIGQSGK